MSCAEFPGNLKVRVSPASSTASTNLNVLSLFPAIVHPFRSTEMLLVLIKDTVSLFASAPSGLTKAAKMRTSTVSGRGSGSGVVVVGSSTTEGGVGSSTTGGIGSPTTAQ